MPIQYVVFTAKKRVVNYYANQIFMVKPVVCIKREVSLQLFYVESAVQEVTLCFWT